METTQQASAALFVDAGWGDWRIADSPNTRVTVAQFEAVSALAGVESIGASDVRFGDQTGELAAFHDNGRVSEIGVDGTVETFDE